MAKKRASTACQACHDRKVRCNLAQSGPPCVNCSLDALACVERPNKRRRLSRTTEDRATPRQFHFVAEEPAATCIRKPTPGDDAASNPRDANAGPGPLVVPVDTSPREAAAAADPQVERGSSPYRPFYTHFSHHEKPPRTGSNSPNDDDADEGSYAPIYGDPRTASLVADIIEPERRGKTGHFLVPDPAVDFLAAEDIEYLRMKGAFALPDAAICDRIIRLYFRHVHPFFPLVDPIAFFANYDDGSRSKLSIHLLWSMFLAASNFADPDLLRELHCESRKEMKRSMYRKAKALYDAGYERDKITLIQAVLLMAFWFVDTDDRSGSWHWNGVAISLCQTIGLHRKPNALQGGRRSISEDTQRQWRQIWWCCFHREVWFAIGLGRPMRINPDDCNLPLPTASDSDLALEGLSTRTRERYFVEDTSTLSELWTDLMKLTVSLADIISLLRRAERSKLTRAEMEETERKLRALPHLKKHLRKTHSRITTLHVHHMELYVESTMLVLYRPQFFELPRTESPRSATEWSSIVEHRVRSSTACINRILDILVSEDMINQCHSMICIALIPVLQIHLLDSTSSKPLVRRIGHNRLELCMIVVEELRDTFFGAEIIHRMFPKAETAIQKRNALLRPASRRGNDCGQERDAGTGLRSDGDSTLDANPANDIMSMTFETLNPFASVHLDGFFSDEPTPDFRYWPTDVDLAESF